MNSIAGSVCCKRCGVVYKPMVVVRGVPAMFRFCVGATEQADKDEHHLLKQFTNEMYCPSCLPDLEGMRKALALLLKHIDEPEVDEAIIALTEREDEDAEA